MRKINEITFNKDTIEDLKIQGYLLKYIKELQRHFDIPNKKIRIILFKIYKELSPFNTIKKFTKKMFNMIKSKYKKITVKRK